MRYNPSGYQGVPNQREFRAAATGRSLQWERSDRPAALAAYLNATFRSWSIEEDPLKQLAGWVWMSWNACSPTGGRSAAANWTDRGCKPGWTRFARTPRCFGARLLLRGFQGGDLLRQSLGTVSGVVVVRLDRRCRAHEQPCGTHPALGRAMAEERLWLPQRGGVSVCGADVDRGPNPAVAETSGAGLPVSRDRGASVRPAPQLLGQAGD